jgi:hypothetical protein
MNDTKSWKTIAYTIERTLFWILLVVSLSFNILGWNDYTTMESQVKYMKMEFVDDVVGYNYCDREDNI